MDAIAPPSLSAASSASSAPAVPAARPAPAPLSFAVGADAAPLRAPRNARRIALLALGLGVLADVFFDGVPLGIGWPLFLAAALGAFLAAGGREAWERARPAAWLLWPMAATALFVGVRDSPELAVLNVAASSLCLLLFAHFATAEESAFSLGPAALVSRALLAGPRALLAGPPTVKASLEDVPLRALGGKLAALARTAAVAVPVVLVFAGLLAAADPMFSSLVERALEAVGLELWSTMLSRTLTVAGAGLAMAGVLSFALRRHRPLPAAVQVPGRLSLRTSATVLGLVSLLFVAFGLVQARFLFGGDHGRLPIGLTYAQYAHQGFFQLVAVVVLTLLLILALGRWTHLGSALEAAAFKSLGTGLVLCAMPLWASAVQRMVIYQDAYGATVLRVFVLAFLCATSVLLAWRAVSLWVAPVRFGGGALLLCLLSALALDVANPDALVASHNLARKDGAVVLDTWYLRQLSADAVPAVERGSLALDPEVREAVLFDLRARAAARTSRHPAAWNAARARAQAR